MADMGSDQLTGAAARAARKARLAAREAGLLPEQSFLQQEQLNGVAATKKRKRQSSSSSSSSRSSSSSSSGRRKSKKAKGPMRASHILIKYAGSRNPVSNSRRCTVRISAEEASAELQKIMDKILAEGATEKAFAKYAMKRSDCSSFSKGGDLGSFDAEAMQPAFSKATRATKIGTMSGIVKTDSGFHLIFRTG